MVPVYRGGPGAARWLEPEPIAVQMVEPDEDFLFRGGRFLAGTVHGSPAQFLRRALRYGHGGMPPQPTLVAGGLHDDPAGLLPVVGEAIALALERGRTVVGTGVHSIADVHHDR